MNKAESLLIKKIDQLKALLSIPFFPFDPFESLFCSHVFEKVPCRGKRKIKKKKHDWLKIKILFVFIFDRHLNVFTKNIKGWVFFALTYEKKIESLKFYKLTYLFLLINSTHKEN